jgi:hypothetical protein
MGNIVKKCNKCGRFCVCSDDDYLIDGYKGCDGLMVDTGIKFDDYLIISKISSDDSFLQAMIDLKEKDIIEYNLKMSQFKSQLEQQKSNKVQNDNTPRCPHCRSTNIRPISGLNRGASIAMWGIFSKKINKSFECLNCKYTW